MYTLDEYNIVFQKQREIFAKVELLNFKSQVVGELVGNVVGDPSFSIDATSNLRRSCNISIYPTNYTFDIASETYNPTTTKIWLDKYIKISYGIKDIRSENIVYTNMGVYLINNPSQVYSSTENTINLQLIDLMANLTGLRKGNIEGLSCVIPINSNIREQIIGLLSYVGFTNYIIDLTDEVTPWEMSVSAGGSIYDMLSKILECMPNYQMFFDVNGVFHFEKIPNGVNEQIYLNDEMWKEVLTSYNKDTNMENVKNSIEVFGGTHDIQYYSLPYEIVPSVEMPNEWCFDVRIPSIGALNLNDITDWENVKIGFTTPYQPEEMLHQPNRIKLNQTYEFKIEYPDTEVPIYKLDTYYVFYFKNNVGTNATMEYMGGIQPYCKIEDTNQISPFYVDGSVGRLRKVFSDGDYTNINSDYYARQRAEYEFYLYNTLQNNIVLTCKPIYFCDVNKVIEITLPNKQGQEITQKYIIKSVSTTGGVSGTQTISCCSYMPTE